MCIRARFPVESLAGVDVTAEEAQQGYTAYKAASSRIVIVFRSAHFNKLSEFFLASSAGSRWASKSVGLGKGSKGNGR